MRYALEHGAGLTGSAICDRDDESRAEPAGDRGGAERLAIGKEDRPARNWTKEQDRILREMVKAGEPGSVVAAALRKTRNAVIGRAHRLGLTFAGGKPKSVSVEANRKQGGIKGGVPGKKLVEARQKAKGDNHRRSRVARNIESRKLDPVFIEPPAPVIPVDPLRLHLVDLKRRSCRFIVEGAGAFARYCGHESKVGSSYCPHHHARLYTRAERVEA